MMLPKLPEGQYYVVSGGKEVMDHLGNVYTVEYSQGHAPVRESTTAEAPELPYSASPRNLPNEVPVGNGYCVRPPTKALPEIALSEQALRYLREEALWMADQPVEHFVVFSLNAAGDIIGRQDYCDHQPKSCTVPLPTVAQETQRQRAAGALAVHNHPRAHAWSESQQRPWAGACEPSSDDIQTTTQLREALAAMGIRLVDHLICGPHARGYSFAEATTEGVNAGASWDQRQAWLESQPAWFQQLMSRR
jgi:RadC-like JAB domain